jgi:hypothetical protein
MVVEMSGVVLVVIVDGGSKNGNAVYISRRATGVCDVNACG